MTEAPTPCVLTADTLPELRGDAASGLVQTDPHPADPPDVVEVWLSEA